MKRDRLGMEIEKIMEEETLDIRLSKDLKERILMNRKLGLKEKIIEILNREIEIPFIPLLATFTIVILLIGIPRDLIKRQERFRTVDIGSSQIIIKDTMKVGVKNED